MGRVKPEPLDQRDVKRTSDLQRGQGVTALALIEVPSFYTVVYELNMRQFEGGLRLALI